MSGRLCRRCGGFLDDFLFNQGLEYHVGCEPKESQPVSVIFGSPGGLDPFTEQIRKDLTEVIKWADANSTRSLQAEIGPSELGNSCDRFIAYRLAQIPYVNTDTDPWPAIMGTAIHLWLEQAINRFQAEAGARRWTTELTTYPDLLTKGHLDLLDHWERMVCDWKSLGTTKMRQWRKEGPPQHNRDQVQLYAKGAIEAGHEIERVCLIGIPRAGWLRDMIVWTDVYRPDRAQAVLDRRDQIGYRVLDLDILNHPERFEDIPANSDNCSFCPFFRVEDRADGRPADETGCPGMPRS